MKKIILFLLFPITLFSQTLTFNPGKKLDPNNLVEIVFTVDSALNYFSEEELQTSSISIQFEKVEGFKMELYDDSDNSIVKKSRLGNYTKNFSKNITLIQENSNELVFKYTSEMNYFEFFEMTEFLAISSLFLSIELDNYRYYAIDETPFFKQNTNAQKGYSCDGKNCDLYFQVNINKSTHPDYINLSEKELKNNIDTLLKIATSDINLEIREDCGSPTNNCGRWVGNAPIFLSDPIIKDFNGDGLNDIAARVYSHYLGDIDWMLTNSEKNFYFSRFVIFEGDQVINDSVIYKIKEYHDQINEGIKLVDIDYDNDGDLDIYTYPDVYHGFQENKPSNWSGEPKLYTNDGNGSFTEKEFDKTYQLTYLKNFDNDSDNEIIYPTGGTLGKYDARYLNLGEDQATFTYVDIIDGKYQTTLSDDIIITPNENFSIFLRKLNKFQSFDINKDDYNDIILWFEQTEGKSEFFNQDGSINHNDGYVNAKELGLEMRRFFIVFYGSENGFDFSWPSSNSKVLYEYKTIFYEPYDFQITQLNDSTNIFLILDITNAKDLNFYQLNDEIDYPLSVIDAFKINNNSIEKVSDNVFLNNTRLNYYGLPNEFKFRDINNDGLTDLYFWQSNWMTDTTKLPFLFFLNNGSNYEPTYISSVWNDFSTGAPPLNDYDNDGVSDLDFPGAGPSQAFGISTGIGVNYINNDKYFTPKKNVILKILFTEPDTDGDGVNDDVDICPDTPAGAAVDNNGCADSQKDSDGDGITDDLDTCSDSPNGATVDENGCADSQKDSDGDGVFDDVDNCPLTANPDQADWNNNGVGDVCGDPKPLFTEKVTFVENIYPNPTDDRLSIRIKPGLEIVELYFIDFSGKFIKPKSVDRSGDNLDINVSNLNEGIYILELVSDKEVDKVKLVIER